MNKKLLLLTFLLPVVQIGMSQKTGQNLREFGTHFLCDSMQEITKVDFDLHRRKLSILDTSGLTSKIDSFLKIPFGKQFISFNYDSVHYTPMGYKIAGRDKKRHWILVEEFYPQTSQFYLINQKNKTIDTLMGYPYFIDDYVVCIENEQTDWLAPIEVFQIKNERLYLMGKGRVGQCANETLKSYNFYLNENNELMSESASGVDKTYHVFKIPLF